LQWLRDEKREGGPQDFIGFAISVRMSEALRQTIAAIPEAEWKPYPKWEGEEIRECAEVPFVPGERSEHQESQPLRDVAIRVRKRQGELLADGSAVRHFAIRSNLWEWKAEKLIAWHREKAGTVEMVHEVLKNEWAAGVLPSKDFGAKAAGWRLAALAHNVLVALKRLALPAELLSARPKRWRFLFLHTAGHGIHHARKTRLRLSAVREYLGVWIEIGQCLPLRAGGPFAYRRIGRPFSGWNLARKAVRCWIRLLGWAAPLVGRPKPVGRSDAGARSRKAPLIAPPCSCSAPPTYLSKDWGICR
jgi:hypothetical protein